MNLLRKGAMRCAVASIALVLAIAPAAAQKVTLDVLYAQPAFAKYHEPIAQAFMKQYPGA